MKKSEIHPKIREIIQTKKCILINIKWRHALWLRDIYLL